MKKKIISLVLAAAMTVCLAACGETTEKKAEDQALEKLTFVLDWTPNTNHTGIYVAAAKGYFEEAGLDVEIVQPPEDGAELLVASGKAQFGVSFQDYLMPALVGENALPVEAVAAIIQHNTSGIISRAGEGITSPKGMEGKKYATWDLELEKATIRQIMENDGGDYSKIQMIPSTVTDEVSALRSKSVDAIWIFYGWAGIQAEMAGLETDYFAFRDIDEVFDFYTPVIIGNTDWTNDHKETTKAFLSAVKKGYEFAIEEPEAAAEILVEAAPELDLEMVVKSQNYLKDQYKAEAKQWGYIDPVRWNAFYNWINEQGLSQVEIPENTGFNNEYLEN